ncbi:alanine--tRNA ligase [Candidatus Nomurabacteria bacterium CG10_big_fil_rev_8_21_14_0_10_35_16]|uniref:alanine--tRNA ligase n=1 Tax=Candidatus Nomurabacteria bacterium CG10_big_fil_rev_8_21_14_0_10_35_16 TaxID=1974731 RepID=A0A2H0TBN1_9BACT|nr:MAG: alanine--tRNA ligase [Candidatus Nomurabacteria bacterium CG10_big_fil_rev_8_21_14_0_10_35_16]
MESNEIRSRFLKFFENRGHKIIPSASLVPENDPSVLFNTAGMQPLVPYLLGQEHPMGKRIVDIQKCVRTGDLEDIGDNRHLSFFEMMGNWSLGDYFKKEAISWSYEFLTSKEEGLGLNPKFLYITVFEGDENAPKDIESAEIWKSLGIPENRIYFLGAEDNWWSAGDNGPCGPDSEMFYDVTGKVGDLSHAEFVEAVNKEDVIEIWNDVFMEYEKKDGKVIGKLKNKNVDTGAGLERITAVMQGKKSAYDTDLFSSIGAVLIPVTHDVKKKRIIADHIRTSVFLISDGVVPSNKDQGYVLRRLIRRAIFCFHNKKITDGEISTLVDVIVLKYGDIYSNLKEQSENIKNVLRGESDKFNQTILQGLKEFEKGIDPFILFTTYGFPIELTEELAREKGQKIDLDDFHKKMIEHQKLSQTASAGMFKGGLANHSEKTIKLHTAHHLLLAGLQAIVSPSVKQKGSNITEERLRIDFLCDRKLTDEEKQKVEDWVNDKIKQGLDVIRREMPLAEAEKIGAEMEFGAKYPEVVSVYFIEDKNGDAISKEFCGGPHVENTKELGVFKIKKEEAVSAGVRRIKAILS